MSRELGRELWEQRARSGADARYFARPMLKRIAHSLACAHRTQSRCGGTGPRACPATRISSKSLICSSSRPAFRRGHPAFSRVARPDAGDAADWNLRTSARDEAPCRAPARVPDALQPARMRVCWSQENSCPRIRNAIAPLLQHPGIIRTAYLTEPDFGATPQPPISA